MGGAGSGRKTRAGSRAYYLRIPMDQAAEIWALARIHRRQFSEQVSVLIDSGIRTAQRKERRWV